MKKTTKKTIKKVIAILIFTIIFLGISELIGGTFSSYLLGWVGGCLAMSTLDIIDEREED